MELKRYKDFVNESSYFDQYQSLKNLMYDINEFGKFKIYKENWFIYNDKQQKVGSFFMFIDNNKTLIIDKIIFNENSNQSKKESISNTKKFLEQVMNFCDENGLVSAVSPDRIRDRSKRKKIIDFYKEFGFIQNKGKNTNINIAETMYRKL